MISWDLSPLILWYWLILGLPQWNDPTFQLSELPSGYVKIAIENRPFIVDLPIENGDFPIVMLVYQRILWFAQIFESTYIYINSLVNHDNSQFIMIFTQDWYLNSYLFSTSNVTIILQTASLDLSELQRTERNGRGWPTRIGSSQRQRFPFGNPRWHRNAGTRSARLASMVADGRCTSVFRHLAFENCCRAFEVLKGSSKRAT